MEITKLLRYLQEAQAYLDARQLTREEYLSRLGETRARMAEMLPAGMCLLHNPHTGIIAVAPGDYTLAWRDTYIHLEEEDSYEDPHALEKQLEQEYCQRVEQYQHPPRMGTWRGRMIAGMSTAESKLSFFKEYPLFPEHRMLK